MEGQNIYDDYVGSAKWIKKRLIFPSDTRAVKQRELK